MICTWCILQTTIHVVFLGRKKNAYEILKNCELGKMTVKVLVYLFDNIFNCKFDKKLMSGRPKQTVIPYLVSFYPIVVIVFKP